MNAQGSSESKGKNNRNLFIGVGVAGCLLICCILIAILFSTGAFTKIFANTSPFTDEKPQTTKDLKPPYYGVFIELNGELVELQEQEIFSIPTEGDLSNVMAISDMQPVIIVWRNDVNLDYLELYKLNQYLGESKNEVRYNATPQEDGVIEIRPVSTLDNGVYCLIQGDPLAAILLGWCFRIGDGSQNQLPITPVANENQSQSGCFSEDIFCVGLVTDVGTINDKSFNQLAWEGVQLAETELGASVKYIETTDARDYGKNIALFGDDGYDVIVTVGFAMGEATIAAATIYPNTKFIGVDQIQSQTIENVAGLNFPEDKAGFVVGALAAMMSKSHKIGAVCGTDVVPPVWRFGEGYRAGSAYADNLINITTDVFVIYHSDVGFDKTFTDPEWGASTAKAMMDQGVDAIFGCGGITGNGAIIATAQAGNYAIGVDIDQYFTLPEAAPRMLSSALKLITPSVLDILSAIKNGNFTSGNVTGLTGYAPYHDLANEVPDSVKTLMEKINAGLLDGSIETNVAPVKP